MGGEFDFVKETVKSNAVVVFSKTYCPHCTTAKRALNSIGAKFKTFELDEMDNGSAIQSALAQITGRRTVPNVFVGGSSIGGGDETATLNRSGKLLNIVSAVGAI